MEGGIPICDGPDEFRKAVRDEIKQGVEIIKLYPTGGHGFALPADVMTMTPEEMKAAADTAHERGKKIRGHIISKRGILAALDLKFDLIDHGDMMDDECIERLVEAGHFRHSESLLPIPDGRAEAADRQDRVFQRRDGARPRIFVQDAAQGECGRRQVGDRRRFRHRRPMHGDYAKELEAYVKGAGIPALDVIGWATRNGAEMLGMKDDLGTIEAGKLADLLVVNGDPVRDIAVLQDRANLDVIMKGGKFVEYNLTPGKAVAKSA